jgi:hypothetical protein
MTTDKPSETPLSDAAWKDLSVGGLLELARDLERRNRILLKDMVDALGDKYPSSRIADLERRVGVLTEALAWCVGHPDDCPGDYPEHFKLMRAALAGGEKRG